MLGCDYKKNQPINQQMKTIKISDYKTLCHTQGKNF